MKKITKRTRPRVKFGKRKSSIKRSCYSGRLVFARERWSWIDDGTKNTTRYRSYVIKNLYAIKYDKRDPRRRSRKLYRFAGIVATATRLLRDFVVDL